MKTYIVKHMIEQDFGCEGRPEGTKIKTEVTLRDEEGELKTVVVDDEELLQKDINEGDIVYITSEGEIIKA